MKRLVICGDTNMRLIQRASECFNNSPSMGKKYSMKKHATYIIHWIADGDIYIYIYIYLDVAGT